MCWQLYGGNGSATHIAIRLCDFWIKINMEISEISFTPFESNARTSAMLKFHSILMCSNLFPLHGWIWSNIFEYDRCNCKRTIYALSPANIVHIHNIETYNRNSASVCGGFRLLQLMVTHNKSKSSIRTSDISSTYASAPMIVLNALCRSYIWLVTLTLSISSFFALFLSILSIS